VWPPETNKINAGKGNFASFFPDTALLASLSRSTFTLTYASRVLLTCALSLGKNPAKLLLLCDVSFSLFSFNQLE